MWRFVFPKFGDFFPKKENLQKNIPLKKNIFRNLLEFHTKKKRTSLYPGS
jgi:hypothetical protein